MYSRYSICQSTRISHQFSGLRSKGKLFFCQCVWSLGRVLFVCSSSARHAGYRVISYFIARLSTANFALEGEVGVGEINCYLYIYLGSRSTKLIHVWSPTA